VYALYLAMLYVENGVRRFSLESVFENVVKVFFILKNILIIFFYFLKIIFKINTLK